MTKGVPSSLYIGGKQFSKKLNRRAKELELEVSNPRVRHQFRNRIERIFNNADKIRKGSFRGQDSEVFFYRRGKDVVLTKSNGNFITILTNGANNPRFLESSIVK